MIPVGFEPTVSVGERSQTHVLERAATRTTWYIDLVGKIQDKRYKYLILGDCTQKLSEIIVSGLQTSSLYFLIKKPNVDSKAGQTSAAWFQISYQRCYFHYVKPSPTTEREPTNVVELETRKQVHSACKQHQRR